MLGICLTLIYRTKTYLLKEIGNKKPQTNPSDGSTEKRRELEQK
jgi:hypothetical protein